MTYPYTTWAALGLMSLMSLSGAAQAGMGLTQLPGQGSDGPVTVYYPTDAAEVPVQRGPFTLQVAEQAPPARGNGRLVIITHGSGGAPWVHADLARHLVEAGYTVALPEHAGDNYKNPTAPGPASWAQRPAEVSRAIDSVAQHSAMAQHLQLDRVGVFGQSAGGHTALSMAGGAWSPARFAQHCEAHLDEDFPACVGTLLRLSGGFWDGFKRWAARTVLRWTFTDTQAHTHHDPRVAAAIAGVPAAADFDPESLRQPRIPLGLMTSAGDIWLRPRFHSDAVLAACAPHCEHLLHLPQGGHSAYMSPLPPAEVLGDTLGALLADPPGFDRLATVPEVNQHIRGFFDRHLAPSTR